MRTPIPTIAIGGLLLGTTSYADTYPRQPGVDAIHYVFRLTFEDATYKIAGETTATVRLLAPVKEVVLDLTSDRGGKGMTVSAVSVAGQSVTFTHAEDRLHIPLPAGAAAGADIALVVTYSGVPAQGLRLIDNICGERTMFSENWRTGRGSGCR